MNRKIFCQKMQQEAEGLDFSPYPGPLGERIFNEICKTAWQQWLHHQTMLINEYRLNMLDPQAREFLQAEMQKFLFGDGTTTKPEGYVAPKIKKK